MGIADIKLLALDVDGVLTNGSLLFTPDGQELKQFHSRDGVAFKWLRKCNIPIAWITGRSSPTVENRSKELGVEYLYLGSDRKQEAFLDLQRQSGLKPHEIAYMGDDLIDLPILTQAGWAITVPEAPEEVRSRVHFITQNGGGFGAVREVVEQLLKEKGLWDAILSEYLP